MTDETTEPRDEAEPTDAAPEEPGRDAAADAGAAVDAGAETPDEAPGEARKGKHPVREGVAKAVGYTVEVASILGQQAGPAVEAERDVAEADTEDLIDRIDGED